MTNWSGGLQGAAGGAMAGTSIGGPVGGLVGGGLGLLGGLFGGDGSDPEVEANRQRMLQFYNQLGQQGPAAQAGYSDFRGNQANLISNLEAQASGRGPSLAGEQLKAATDRNSKQQMGLAQTGAGNPAAAGMMAQNNIAQLGAQSAQDAAQARIQEIYNAQNLLGLNIQSGRGADEGINTFNAQQTNMGRSDLNRTRAGLLMGGMGQGSRGGPSMGEQILAGGGGMYGQSQQMAMLNRGNPAQGGGQYSGNMNSMLGRAQPGQPVRY
mgnify:CR=1 FL=1